MTLYEVSSEPNQFYSLILPTKLKDILSVLGSQSLHNSCEKYKVYNKREMKLINSNGFRMFFKNIQPKDIFIPSYSIYMTSLPLYTMYLSIKDVRSL